MKKIAEETGTKLSSSNVQLLSALTRTAEKGAVRCTFRNGSYLTGVFSIGPQSVPPDHAAAIRRQVRNIPASPQYLTKRDRRNFARLFNRFPSDMN